MRHKGNFGWQNVGKAFGIDNDHLDYMKLSHKRNDGSPTKILLEILAAQGKTVGDLINALKSPKVNRQDVASLILQHIAM